jgi:hypothetical protein
MNTYLIYVRDVFLGKAKGRDETAAIKRFVDDCGFDSLDEYAKECFAEPSDIHAKMAGVF